LRHLVLVIVWHRRVPNVRPSNPITGIAGCCARAASGHVTAASSSAKMNARRLQARCN